MYCNKINSLTGCGSCKIYLMNKPDITLLNNQGIYYIVHSLLNNTIINQEVNNQIINIYASYVTCNGEFNIIYNQSKRTNTKEQIRMVIFRVIHTWMISDKENIFESYMTMYLCSILYIFMNENNKDTINMIEIMKSMMCEMFDFED